jgi:hypothetical protein
MEQHVDSTSVRGLLLTMGLWMVAHVTASQVATYCTILSAIVTIIVNIQKFKNGKDKHRTD